MTLSDYTEHRIREVMNQEMKKLETLEMNIDVNLYFIKHNSERKFIKQFVKTIK